MVEDTNLGKLSDLLRDALNKYGYVWVKLVGKSMLPFFKNGALIAVHKADIKDIHIGDVILFKKGDIAIAHRVFKKVNRDGQFFLGAKSDISFASGPLINYEELIGKAVAFKCSQREIKIDNFAFRFLGLCAGAIFPFIARVHFAFKTVAKYAVQS